MKRNLYEPDHEAFREIVQAYVKREVTPNLQRWDEERSVDRQAWLAAGKQAIIGLRVPERFGGPVWHGCGAPGTGDKFSDAMGPVRRDGAQDLAVRRGRKGTRRRSRRRKLNVTGPGAGAGPEPASGVRT
jgi:alkylation response protein AidB-like acyl-CoA dehydrogenase